MLVFYSRDRSQSRCHRRPSERRLETLDQPVEHHARALLNRRNLFVFFKDVDNNITEVNGAHRPACNPRRLKRQVKLSFIWSLVFCRPLLGVHFAHWRAQNDWRTRQVFNI